MKRTAKNEQTNERNATTRRYDGVEKRAARPTDFSQALRRSTAALALTCGVCVGVSGCQSFLGSADERFRQGRGEYALNDEAARRDWEEAAREMGKPTQNEKIGENGRNGASGQDAEKDPAASRPVLRSASFDETSEGAERRVAARKPVSGWPAFEEPEAPKSFGERVKGLFSFPKKEPRRSNDPPTSPAAPVSRNSINSGRNENFARSAEPKKTARSSESGFSLGRGLSNVFSSSKRRGREKFPVDPVLQYDESRFMPSFQTCEQYYAPVEPRRTVEQPLPSSTSAKSEKTAQKPGIAQSARTGDAVATKTAKNRQDAAKRISGRALVAKSEKQRTSPEEPSGWATSGVASSKASATGWGKTRPISIASNEESATAKAPVAPVGYLGAPRKNRTDFQVLTERCDGFFGWETEDEALLNAISEPTGEVGESLTAYSTAPSPTASAFPVVEPTEFATDVAEIATGNGATAAPSRQTGQDASTLTERSPTQETTAPSQNVLRSPLDASLASNEPTAGLGEVAETAQVGEDAANPATAPVLTAYAPSGTRKNASERSDLASQLGETGFDWFDSRTSNDAVQTPVEAAPVATTVATLESEITSSVPGEAAKKSENETLELISGKPRVDLDAALARPLPPPSVAEVGKSASTLPVAPPAVAEIDELASTFPVAPPAVAEIDELASTLPVAPPAVAEVGELASTLPVAPPAVAEVGEPASTLPVAPPVVAEIDELASTFPVAPSSVAEVGEPASTLPVAPTAVAEVGEPAPTLPVAPPAVAEIDELASTLPVATPAVAEIDELASTFPVAPPAVAEVGEPASTFPVAPSAVAEVGEPASTLPVAPTSLEEGVTPVAVEALDVEAPRALAAVEEVVGEENGVAGPNFALAAPGLGAGEAIQGAADERKNAAVAKPLSGDEIAWVEQIKGAIRTLVAERDAKKAAGEDVRRLDARLRLLYLAVDEYDRSIQEIQDDADPLKVFWETERGELETLLQSRLEEIDPTFVAERLRAGLDSLSGLCDLQIRKSALVVAPACFGLYEERAEGYKPGETVFAYAELEYVSCRETEEGRLIDVECRWRLLNADGSELTPVETQRCSNLSETKLRDVVLNVSAPLPSDLAPGTYLLETEVVDMNRPGAKPAKERLELTVVAGENAEKAAE